MLNTMITKHFHRDEGVMNRGDVVKETMTFASHIDMEQWGFDINGNHANVPYNITGIFADKGNFVFYDMSLIEGIYGELPWNEIN